jgi:hypothetical protein
VHLKRSPRNVLNKAQRRGWSIFPTNSPLRTRRTWLVSTTSRPLYRRDRPGTHCTGGWAGLGAGLQGTKYLAPTGIRSPDRPARRYTD